MTSLGWVKRVGAQPATSSILKSDGVAGSTCFKRRTFAWDGVHPAEWCRGAACAYMHAAECICPPHTGFTCAAYAILQTPGWKWDKGTSLQPHHRITRVKSTPSYSCFKKSGAVADGCAGVIALKVKGIVGGGGSRSGGCLDYELNLPSYYAGDAVAAKMSKSDCAEQCALDSTCTAFETLLDLCLFFGLTKGAATPAQNGWPSAWQVKDTGNYNKIAALTDDTPTQSRLCYEKSESLSLHIIYLLQCCHSRDGVWSGMAAVWRAVRVRATPAANHTSFITSHPV